MSLGGDDDDDDDNYQRMAPEGKANAARAGVYGTPGNEDSFNVRD